MGLKGEADAVAVVIVIPDAPAEKIAAIPVGKQAPVTVYSGGFPGSQPDGIFIDDVADDGNILCRFAESSRRIAA